VFLKTKGELTTGQLSGALSAFWKRKYWFSSFPVIGGLTSLFNISRVMNYWDILKLDSLDRRLLSSSLQTLFCQSPHLHISSLGCLKELQFVRSPADL